jgi:hypothetical protein
MGMFSVYELAHVHELRHLAFAHDELGIVLDLLVVVREAVRQGVARIVHPLDDVDELPVDEIHEGHVDSVSVGGRPRGKV